MTSVAAEFDHMEIQQQYSDGVNNRWDADDWDNENSSARLFERSRIKALAGRTMMEGGMEGGMIYDLLALLHLVSKFVQKATSVELISIDLIG